MPTFKGVCVIEHYDTDEFSRLVEKLISANKEFRPEIAFQSHHTGLLMRYVAFVTFWEDGGN